MAYRMVNKQFHFCPLFRGAFIVTMLVNRTVLPGKALVGFANALNAVQPELTVILAEMAIAQDIPEMIFVKKSDRFNGS